jgi:hypothetical protein
MYDTENRTGEKDFLRVIGRRACIEIQENGICEGSIVFRGNDLFILVEDLSTELDPLLKRKMRNLKFKPLTPLQRRRLLTKVEYDRKDNCFVAYPKDPKKIKPSVYLGRATPSP